MQTRFKIESRALLRHLTDTCRKFDPAQLAGVSLTGKREGVFRDALMVTLAKTHDDHLARAEWQIPVAAMTRWKKTRFAGDKAKGIVDLVLVPRDDLLSETPALAVELKLWYWFDALNKKKYVKPGKSNHHLISNSFLADASKLRAVSPEALRGRIIVTVVPTFHTDEIDPPKGLTARQYLAELGFPYSGLGGVMVNSKYKSIELMRRSALRQISGYFERQGCPTLVSGNLRGTYKEVPVTTDFVVSEIPPLSRCS
jgi:hypothetical protein